MLLSCHCPQFQLSLRVRVVTLPQCTAHYEFAHMRIAHVCKISQFVYYSLFPLVFVFAQPTTNNNNIHNFHRVISTTQCQWWSCAIFVSIYLFHDFFHFVNILTVQMSGSESNSNIWACVLVYFDRVRFLITQMWVSNFVRNERETKQIGVSWPAAEIKC